MVALMEHARRPKNRRVTYLALVALIFLGGWRSGEAFFAPDAKLWPRWQAHAQDSTEAIDFSDWSAWLARSVDPSDRGTRIAYGRVPETDRQALEAIIERMSDVRISGYNRDQQLAYWINLYNALTARVVLEHYPVESPRDIDISPGMFSKGPWGRLLSAFEGDALSLNDIEHRIIRPIWDDPRIHYAVNCAAISCPDLRAEAYTGSAIGAQLDEQARSYVNDPRGVSIERGKVTVSKIYDWYIDDFGGTEEAVLDHLADYAEPPLAARLAQIGEIGDVAYDWSLNEAR